MRVLSFAAGASLAHGARRSVSSLQQHQKSTQQVQSETLAMSMLENVASASGYLNQTSTALTSPQCDSMWDPSLDARYHNKRVVGSGATACVYLAHQNEDNRLVAVKVGKSTESLAQWQQECMEMQLLRLGSCRLGPQINHLNEQYIPTCLGVYSTDSGNVYVMHAAGTLPIEQIFTNGPGYTQEQRKGIYAQFVGALWGMHSQDYTHNDLHGKNIVLNPDPHHPELAVIDFGNMIQGQELSAKVGYMRDGNAAWRWAAFLAECPGNAQWDESAGGFLARQLADNFKICMRDVWGVDERSMAAFESVLQKDVDESPAMGIRGLFSSPFIQSHLPRFQAQYLWEGSNGCLDWSNDEKIEHLRQVEFQNHWKCPSVPTYSYERVSTHGREVKRRVVRTMVQCPQHSSACYSNIPGVIWACGGGLIRQVHCDDVSLPQNSGHSGKFDGACLNERHAAYKYAKPWPGWVSTTTTTTTFRRRFSHFLTTVPRRVVTTTTLPAGPQCDCSTTQVPDRPGCDYHLGRNHRIGRFCYIEGGLECPHARFSRSKNSHYRPCEA